MPEDEDNLPDSDLFRQYIGAITPTKSERQVDITKKPKPKPYKKVFSASPIETEPYLNTQPTITGNESIFFAQPGLQGKTLKRLKRGQLEIEDRLDLHGLTQTQALGELKQFMQQQAELGHRHVLLVHGKGLRSKNQHAVLKNLSVAFLKNQPDVLALCSAQAKDGGQGALYILLKRLNR